MSSGKAKSGITLSIVIPCKNRQQLLNELLHEIARQIHSNSAEPAIEIIVIDSGSQPALEQPQLPNTIQLYWLRQPKNPGAQRARKMGFDYCSGQYIHFHDSDDNIGPNWLSKLLEHTIKSPNSDLILSARKVRDNSGISFRAQHFVERYAKQPHKIRQRLRYNNCIGPLGGVTFSRNAVERMSFDPLPSSQDWDMYLEALTNSAQIVADSSFYFVKNEKLDDRISTSLRKKLLGFLRLGRKHGTYSPKNTKVRLFYLYHTARNFPLDNHPRLRAIYNRHRTAIYIAVVRIELLKFLQRFS